MLLSPFPRTICNLGTRSSKMSSKGATRNDTLRPPDANRRTRLSRDFGRAPRESAAEEVEERGDEEGRVCEQRGGVGVHSAGEYTSSSRNLAKEMRLF